MPARFRDNIKKMKPYNPPLEGRASKGYLLLDFNEMTMEPGPKVKEALHKFVDSGRLQVYPEYGNVNEIVAQYAGCQANEVMLTNGADQAIDVIMRAFLDAGDKVIIPSPSFAMFYQSACLQDAEILKPRYAGETLDFPFTEVLKFLDQDPKLLVLCNPNNPTGTAISLEDVRRTLEKASTKGIAVLHDEAYFEFSGITAKDFLKDFDNLFITRTLSKQFGVVSSRIGYVMSQEQNIEQLLKIRGPYDVNMFAVQALIAAFENPEYSKTYIQEVMQKAKPMLENFLHRQRITFYPSKGNFILIKPENPQKILEGLRARGILIRPREDPPGTLRISIGRVNDIQRFFEAFLFAQEG